MNWRIRLFPPSTVWESSPPPPRDPASDVASPVPRPWYQRPAWWIAVGGLIIIVIGALTDGDRPGGVKASDHDRSGPAGTPEPHTGRPEAHTGRELNLFWHYERDLRAMLRYELDSVGRLRRDVGLGRVETAARHFVFKQMAEGVAVLAGPLQLTEAERQAWIRMLPVLQQDEQRPIWQRAGVRR
jgi:hypothetical protein